MDFSFMGGSMGSAVGEKFVRACDAAIAARHAAPARHELRRRPDAGGDPLADAAAEDDLRDRRAPRGAAAALLRPHRTRPPAARMASFATLGDVDRSPSPARCSRSPARASSRSIVKEKLSDDFGRAEQNLRFGQIDAIVPRPEQRPYLARLLRLFER